jgi:hypothetical protein
MDFIWQKTDSDLNKDTNKKYWSYRFLTGFEKTTFSFNQNPKKYKINNQEIIKARLYKNNGLCNKIIIINQPKNIKKINNGGMNTQN